MSETLIERWMRRPHFTCPRCAATSWNPNDIAQLYCGRCHLFFAPPEVWPLPRQGEPLNPRPHKHTEPARYSSEPARRRDDDDVSNPFPTFSTPSYDPPTADPLAAPDFDPGGGSSGGGGASGDW